MKFKISPNWDCVKTYQELKEDAMFIFLNDDQLPRLVIKTPIEGFNLVAISYDHYGIIIDGIGKFNEQWGESIKDSSENIDEFIADFLVNDGATDLIVR